MIRITSGELRGRLLKSPPKAITRPTSNRVRQSIFNILLHKKEFSFQGTYILDLFAGSGAMGIEALSHGAKKGIFVDKNPVARQVIKENLKALSLYNDANVVGWNAITLPPTSLPVDVIFMDPPYHQDLEDVTLNQLLLKQWVKKGTLIVMETFIKTPIPPQKNELSLISHRTFSNTSILIWECF